MIKFIKRTVREILSDPSSKDGNAQRYPGNLSLINNVGDTVVFLGLKVYNISICFPEVEMRNSQKAQMKIISFQNYKPQYIIQI